MLEENKKNQPANTPTKLITSQKADEFKGFYSPRSTSIPDNFFDRVMADLSGAELKVLLYIFRRTFGFKKDSDNISLSQIADGIITKNGKVLDKGTGLGKASVARALKGLVAKGMVKKTRRRSLKKGDEPTAYEPIMASDLPVSQNDTPPSLKIRQAVSQNDTHNITGYKKQLYKSVNVNGGETFKKKNSLDEISKIDQSEEKVKYLVKEIGDWLKNAGKNDDNSIKFHFKVARRIPESVIRQFMSEIKADGANDPARVFTFKVMEWARLKTDNDNQSKNRQTLDEMRQSITRQL